MRYNNSFKEKAYLNDMKKVIMFAALLLLCSSFVIAANCPPSYPKLYFGQVLYEGEVVSGNYEIRAVMDDVVVGIGDVIVGDYEIDVSPCAGTTGVVRFYINGIATEEDGS